MECNDNNKFNDIEVQFELSCFPGVSLHKILGQQSQQRQNNLKRSKFCNRLLPYEQLVARWERELLCTHHNTDT